MTFAHTVQRRAVIRLSTADVPSSKWVSGSRAFGESLVEPIVLAGGPTDELPEEFLEGIDVHLAGSREPARGGIALRRALSRVISDNQTFEPDSQILVTNGAMQALDCTMRALLERGDHVATICPTFFVDRVVEAAGGVPVLIDTYPADNWRLTDQVLATVRATDFSFLFLVNPNNPTGVVYTARELRALLDICREKRATIIVDEAYEAFVYEDNEHLPLAHLADPNVDAVVTVRSFTKSFGLRGARVGYVFGESRLINRIASVFEWTGLACNPLSQHLALKALEYREVWQPKLQRTFATNWALAGHAIASGAVSKTTPVPQGGTFLTLETSEISERSIEAARIIWRKAGIPCVPGVEFPGSSSVTDGFVRLPMGAAPELFEEVLSRIAQVFTDARKTT